MFTVAITGDMGSGKSTLARVWKGLGANVVDLDEVAKRQWSQPDVIKEIKSRWGDSIYSDDVPDFAKIARIIFNNDDEYNFAMTLLYPGTLIDATRIARDLKGWIVLEIPLLFEVGWFDLIDCVICVTSTADLRAARNTVRGWEGDEISRRERFLIGSSKKQAMSDMVLCNVGSLDAWEARARELGDLMRRMSTVHELRTRCDTPETAEKIAASLLKDRIVASADIRQTLSRYWWNGALIKRDEWALYCLTMEKNLRRAMESIRHNHTYDLPAITATEVMRSDFQTLKWVIESCS